MHLINSKDIFEQMPDVYKAINGRYFISSDNMHFIIKCCESDISRLVLRDGATCLDLSLPPRFELRVYEVEPIPNRPGFFNYYGLSGQFSDVNELAGSYGISLENIVRSTKYH